MRAAAKRLCMPCYLLSILINILRLSKRFSIDYLNNAGKITNNRAETNTFTQSFKRNCDLTGCHTPEEIAADCHKRCEEHSDIPNIFVTLHPERFKYHQIMCTVTLEFDQSSALARRKLAALLATGLFLKVGETRHEPTPKEVEAHRQLRDAALEHSRKSMSPIIARYL